MTPRPPPAAELAQRLLAHMAHQPQASEAVLDAADTAHRQLRDRLALVLGQGGVDALWARALHLAQPGAQSLAVVVDGHPPAAAHDRVLAVFSQCFALLSTFIGDDLSFRLFQQAWPAISFADYETTDKETTS